jgi:1-acyl-sn-glycerol-3-phosphate acyltransferase
MKASFPQPNIPAAKNAFGDEALYQLFARPALQGTFHRIWAQTAGPGPQPVRGPYMIYLNHSSWWDGYMMMLIHRRLFSKRLDSYVMMEEKQLRLFRFFTWTGAFSIDRHDPEDAQRALAYAVYLLQRHSAGALYIFPQGRIEPNDRRPLTIHAGAARIAAQVDTLTLLPVAFRYEFLNEQWPHAFVRVGPPHRLNDPQNISASQDEMHHHLTACVDTLRDQVLARQFHSFRLLMRGRVGIDEVFGGLFARLNSPKTRTKR